MEGQTSKANDFSHLVLATIVFHNQLDIVLQHPDHHTEEIGSHSHNSTDNHHAASPFLEEHLVAGCVDSSGATLDRSD